MNNFKNDFTLLGEKIDEEINTLKNQNKILREQNKSKDLTIERLECDVNKLKIDLEDTKKSIILSSKNANRGGRKPVLTENDIAYIQQLRSDGLTVRKIAEMIDKSLGTISKVVNNQYTTNKDNGGNKEMGQMRVSEPPKDKKKLMQSIEALKYVMNDDLVNKDTKSYENHKQALDVYERALEGIINKEKDYAKDTTNIFGSADTGINRNTNYFSN